MNKLTMEGMVNYFKIRRIFSVPLDVCMVGGHYAEEDLPSVSDKALEVMLTQAKSLRDFDAEHMKSEDENIARFFKLGY